MNKVEVNRIRFNDLSAAEQKYTANNGCGQEDARYLRVLLNGVTVKIVSDAMEPEDARFDRDLEWIEPLLLMIGNAS